MLSWYVATHKIQKITALWCLMKNFHNVSQAKSYPSPCIHTRHCKSKANYHCKCHRWYRHYYSNSADFKNIGIIFLYLLRIESLYVSNNDSVYIVFVLSRYCCPLCSFLSLSNDGLFIFIFIIPIFIFNLNI